MRDSSPSVTFLDFQGGPPPSTPLHRNRWPSSSTAALSAHSDRVPAGPAADRGGAAPGSGHRGPAPVPPAESASGAGNGDDGTPGDDSRPPAPPRTPAGSPARPQPPPPPGSARSTVHPSAGRAAGAAFEPQALFRLVSRGGWRSIRQWLAPPSQRPISSMTPSPALGAALARGASHSSAGSHTDALAEGWQPIMAAVPSVAGIGYAHADADQAIAGGAAAVIAKYGPVGRSRASGLRRCGVRRCGVRRRFAEGQVSGGGSGQHGRGRGCGGRARSVAMEGEPGGTAPIDHGPGTLVP